jgi:nitric oxide reductase NorQ protein
MDTTTTDTTTTATATPSVSPAVADKVALLRMKQHLRKSEELLTKHGESKSRIAGLALLSALTINGHDMNIMDAIKFVSDPERIITMGLKIPLVEATTRTIIEAMEKEDWDTLLAIAEGKGSTPAPEPEKAAAPKRATKPKPAAPTGRGIRPPEMPKIDVPTLTANPADPMTAIATAIRPHMDHSIQKALSELVDKLGMSMDDLAKQINTSLASGSGIDETAVKGIVTKSLSNGAGEEIKKLVASQTPNVLADVLDKAAKAIAASGPQQDTTVTLSAAFDPIPDPTYCWTPDLMGVADMLNQARQASPQNALLAGPTGAGKTEFAIQLAARHGLKVMVMDCANIREARDFFGQKGASNGCTYFRKSQFWLAVERGNCVILLDEFNRAADHVRNSLMPLLDHRRQSFVEEVGETLKVGPGTVFIATMNEGLDYSGTHTTDKAMKDRFIRRIELSYLPEDKEIQVLLDKAPGLNKNDARKLVELANVVRSKATGFGGTLSETISTRRLIAAAQDFVQMGVQSFQFTVFAHFDASEGTNSERAQVISAFEGKGYNLAAATAAAAQKATKK